MKFTNLFFTAALGLSVLLYACKDKSDDPDPVISDKCASKTLLLSADVTASVKCGASGSITLHAGGSSGFTFQIGSGAFQADSVFSGLPAGTYTFTAKDADGCTKSATFSIAETGTAGSNFTAVKSIIVQRCNQACHISGAGGAPKNIFATDCDIVARGADIKTQSVDGTMGALNSTEKNQIIAWLNAGGKFTD